jgi:hypothetical protein
MMDVGVQGFAQGLLTEWKDVSDVIVFEQVFQKLDKYSFVMAM